MKAAKATKTVKTAKKTVKKVTKPRKEVIKAKKLTPANGNGHGFKKQFLKNNTCKVTFKLPKEACENSKTVFIVGDFNSWDTKANKMSKLKNGSYTLNLNLETGKDYQFRYLIDNMKFENDWNADCYAPNPFGGDNSIVSLTQKS